MGKVGEWKASYYCNGGKTWIYGQFMIYTRCIRFIEDKGGTSGLDFRIYFEDFFELKKETTTIFFAAITIRVKTDKYWFSSFTDRGHVFNTTEHFWKERLFASSEDQAPRNTELLNMLYDAQNTLTSTGQTVQRQGQQIDSACANMNKIHNDLGVAETLIYNLDSWLSKWNIETPHVHIDVPDSNMVIEKAEYPIVYAKTQKEKHLPGTLTVSNKSLEFFNAERSLDVFFAVKEVTEVSVHTPWEVTISQLRIGHPGRSVHLIAARLVHILQTLEVLLPGKINYDEPPSDAGDQDTYDMDSDRFPLEGDESEESSQEKFQPGSSTREKHSKVVTDAEAAEMGRVLQDMRGLALGIQEEQDRQLQQLDLLSDSVDKANERIRTDVRKIHKLT
ncbi:hypothetical protein ACROYT_G025953 [Oculina patagonica]